MNNRISQTFDNLRLQKKKAFIAFITAGHPSLKATYNLVLALEQAGVDIIELGVPFSDPMAEGVTIQASSQWAIKQGASLQKVLNLVKHLRERTQIPIALMTYYNIVFNYADEKFVKDAVACGVDGVIIPDLPPAEAGLLRKAARTADFATVFFIAPTTALARIKPIADASSGFIYYISLTGVTGARRSLPPTIIPDIKRIKRVTNKPICVGFGISTPQQVAAINRFADGVIVGSAIVKEIQKYAHSKNLVAKVTAFVRRLISF